MWMDGSLRSIDKERVESLLRNGIREGRLIDYKETQPAPKNKPDNTDFLVDVSGMANGGGGLLVYGIAEARDHNKLPTGVPARIDGLKGFNLDAEEARLRQYIKTGLDPALPPDSIEFHGVDGFDDGPVVLLRVRRSWRGPHMVAATGQYRDTFHIRDGNTNRKLDAQGIREVMMAMEHVGERIETLVTERVRLLNENSAPILLRSGARIALHVIPLASISSRLTIEPRVARKLWNGSAAFPLFCPGPGSDDRYNVDGLVIAAKPGPDQSFGSYLQVFRAGFIEAVDSTRIDFNVRGTKGDMPSKSIEQELFVRIPAYMKYLKELDCEAPYAIHVTLLGVKDYCHHDMRDRYFVEGEVIPCFDRQVVRLPQLVIEADQVDMKPTSLLEPLIHAFWQAGGVEACPRYRYDEYDPRGAEVW